MNENEPRVKPPSEIHRVFVVIEVLISLLRKLDGTVHLAGFEELRYVGGNVSLERFNHVLGTPLVRKP